MQEGKNGFATSNLPKSLKNSEKNILLVYGKSELRKTNIKFFFFRRVKARRFITTIPTKFLLQYMINEQGK